MNHRSLTEGSINRSLFDFAIPILCTGLLQSLNASVSAIWVGRFLGEAALTAVVNVQPLIFLLTGAALGISMAAMILVGQCIGADNINHARRVIGTSATFFAGTASVMSVAGLILSEPLLTFMRVPPDSLPHAVTYMRVIFLALPSMYMYGFAASIMRSAGDSKTPFYFMLLSVAIDLVLSPTLIFGLGPFPAAGVTGPAFSAFVAQAAGLIALVIHLYRRKHPLCLRKNELAMLRMDLSIVRTLLRKGIPMSAQLLVVSLSSALMIVLVNRFGVDTTAAFGASQQVWTYLLMPAFAVSAAVTAMVAQNVGAQRWDRVRAIVRAGVIYNVLLTGAAVVLLDLFDTHLYQLFLPSGSPALSITSHINDVVAWSFVLLSISVALLGALRGAGAVTVPLFIHAFALLGVRFPLAAALMDRWQADAIWWSFSISSTLAAVLAALYYRYGGWRATRYRNAALVEDAPTPPVGPGA